MKWNVAQRQMLNLKVWIFIKQELLRNQVCILLWRIKFQINVLIAQEFMNNFELVFEVIPSFELWKFVWFYLLGEK